MSDTKYIEKANNLTKVIDIAINILKQFPPKGFSSNDINRMVNSYLEFRNMVIEPQKQYANLASLKILENDIFTFFQESSGITVNEFWNIIKQENLPFKRENKLQRIIKKGKIKNQIEYNFIIDVIAPYISDGLLSEDEIEILNNAIENYENLH